MLHQALRLLLTFQVGMTATQGHTNPAHIGSPTIPLHTQQVCPTHFVFQHSKPNLHTEMKCTLKHTLFHSVPEHTFRTSVAHFSSHTSFHPNLSPHFTSNAHYCCCSLSCTLAQHCLPSLSYSFSPLAFASFFLKS